MQNSWSEGGGEDGEINNESVAHIVHSSNIL